jgi:hypothetical protein
MKGPRPYVVLLVLGIGFVTIILLLLWFRSPEPIYQGKTVSAWFDRLQKQQVSWQQFQLAIDEVGPNNARPFLFARIRREDPWWRKSYQTIWPILPATFQRRWPMPKALDDSVCSTVGFALRSSDPALVAKLGLALSDPNSHVRFTALTALKPGNAQIEIATLAKLLGDPNREIRELAARSLSQMGTQSRPATPQLITALADSNVAVRLIAAGLLGRFGPEAKAAVPALRLLLKDTDWEVRRKAAAALWDIDRDTNALVILIADADKAIQLGSAATRDAPELVAALKMLNELGASVKTAAPAIIQSLVVDGEQTAVQDEFHRRIREIIARIDPAVGKGAR